MHPSSPWLPSVTRALIARCLCGLWTGSGVVKKLLSAKAEINAEHPEGVNALMYAAAGGHLPVVSKLIESGADVSRIARSLGLGRS